MKWIRAVYPLLCVGLLAFSVLYRDRLGMVLFVLSLLLPVMLFLQLLWVKHEVHAVFSLADSVCTVGGTVRYEIKLKNTSYFPSVVKLTLTAENRFWNSRQTRHIAVAAAGKSEQVLRGAVLCPNCGEMAVCLKTVHCQDLLRLFSGKIRLGKAKQALFCLPLQEEFDPLRLPVQTGSGEETYSQTKPGDDPSEVFGIREYRDGDSIRQIHWKLSSKQEQWMVRENSLPLAAHWVLLAELSSAQTPDMLDDLLGAVYSVSAALCEAGQVHEIVWYRNRIVRYAVQFSEDIQACFRVLLSIQAEQETEKMLHPAWNYEQAEAVSGERLCYFSAAKQEEQPQLGGFTCGFFVQENGEVSFQLESGVQEAGFVRKRGEIYES